MALTRRQQMELLRAELDQDRQSYMGQYRDAADYFLPTRARFQITDIGRGDRRNQKIIDCNGTLAANDLSAMMQSGMSSSARTWINMTTPDPDLAEFGPVKQYLDIVNRRLTNVLLMSNYYTTKPNVYRDAAVFATAPYSIEEDFKKTIRCQSYPVGSYLIAKDEYGMVNTFVYDFRMTVRQIVMKYGKVDPKTGKADWSNISLHVRNLWDNQNYNTWIDTCFVVQPNDVRDYRRPESKFKEFAACTYERGTVGNQGNNYMNVPSEDGKFLQEKGFDFFPILCPRWAVTAENVLGDDCPAFTAMGDIKSLQLMHKRKAQGVEKMMFPPMVGPASMAQMRVTTLPNEVSFVDEREGMKGFRESQRIQFSLAEMREDIQDVRFMIDRAFYRDKTATIMTLDRSDVTAEEIRERTQEKYLFFGPVLERFNTDDHGPMVDIVFQIMARQGKLPPPPEEIQGKQLKVEYISIMAQAQKASGLAGIERFTGFALNMAKQTGDNAYIMKINQENILDLYGEGCGVSPKVIRTDEEVAQMKRAQAEAQAQERAAVNVREGAAAAKDLGSINMDQNSALSQLLQASAAGAPVN